jgi:hypothetical protein
MLCYEFHDRIRRGIQLKTVPAPHVPVYPDEKAFGHELLLSDPIASFLGELAAHFPDEELILRRADVQVSKRQVVFTPPRQFDDTQALVRVQTWSGARGAIDLAGASEGEPFPPGGVSVLVTGRARVGSAEVLDTLLVMVPASEFRIVRTGELEGAWSAIRIHWNGRRLTAREER